MRRSLDGTVLGLALAALVGTGCVETFDGNGVARREERALSGFDRVSALGALEVEVTPGEFFVEVNIDENLISRIETVLDSRTLVIRVRGGNLGEVLPGPHVRVRLPSLRDVELNGSGRLTAETFDESDAVSVELSGSGFVSWSGEAPDVEALLNGSGELTLEGDANRLELILNGSGSLDARDLEAGAANIELQGSGNISATVNGRVDAAVEGSGGVELYGDVIQGTWTESEEGSINPP